MSVDLKSRIAGFPKGLLLINDPEFKQMNQIYMYVCYSSFTFSYWVQVKSRWAVEI